MYHLSSNYLNYIYLFRFLKNQLLNKIHLQNCTAAANMTM